LLIKLIRRPTNTLIMMIANNKVASINYTLKDANGNMLESTSEQAPSRIGPEYFYPEPS